MDYITFWKTKQVQFQFNLPEYPSEMKKILVKDALESIN